MMPYGEGRGPLCCPQRAPSLFSNSVSELYASTVSSTLNRLRISKVASSR